MSRLGAPISWHCLNKFVPVSGLLECQLVRIVRSVKYAAAGGWRLAHCTVQLLEIYVGSRLTNSTAAYGGSYIGV